MPPTLAASLHVFAFKEGLLARMAHDLRLSLRDFEVDVDAGRIDARFVLGSLRVDGVAHGEQVDADALPDEDRRAIEAAARDEILELARFPQARFEGVVASGAAGAWDASGRLTLHGATREVPLTVRRAGGELRVEATLTPSRFGIAPYKALAGAIRLQDRVVVRATLAVGDDALRALTARFRPGG